MNLNMNSKNKIRKLIEIMTNEIPDGERIKLDEKLLDDLIFYKSCGKKIPIWTGDFLKKIDLSKISFKNAVLSFQLIEDYYPLTHREILSKKELEELEEEYKKYNGKSFLSAQYNTIMTNQKSKCKYIINFSGTNIKIDFNELLYKKAISNCDFSNVDLSKSNINTLKIITHCNLSNTGISIDFKDKTINNCNLSYNDLSDKEMQINIGNLEKINNNDLSKTGLNIKINQNYISIGGHPITCGRASLKNYIDETINLIQLGIINNKGLTLNRISIHNKIEYLKILGIIRECKLINKKNNIYEVIYDNEELAELLNNLTSGKMEECYINGKQLKKQL